MERRDRKPRRPAFVRLQRVHEDGYYLPLLFYAGDECGDEDIDDSTFFLHVFPANEDDLPANRRRYGYDNLDFHFWEHRLKDQFVPSRVGCAALVELPGYEVARIRTGQASGGVPLWEREVLKQTR